MGAAHWEKMPLFWSLAIIETCYPLNISCEAQVIRRINFKLAQSRSKSWRRFSQSVESLLSYLQLCTLLLPENHKMCNSCLPETFVRNLCSSCRKKFGRFKQTMMHFEKCSLNWQVLNQYSTRLTHTGNSSNKKIFWKKFQGSIFVENAKIDIENVSTACKSVCWLIHYRNHFKFPWHWLCATSISFSWFFHFLARLIGGHVSEPTQLTQHDH